MRLTISCPCPPLEGGPRHPDGDELTFSDALSFRDAIAAQKDMGFAMSGEDEGDADEVSAGDALAALTEQYILRGLEAWTVQDAQGAPVPVTRAAIRAHVLSDWSVASEVSTAVEPLYNPQVLRPLVRRAETLSRGGRTGGSTSAPTGSTRRRRTRSSPSSTSSTPTDGTATTTSWLAGGSRSSRSET